MRSPKTSASTTSTLLIIATLFGCLVVPVATGCSSGASAELRSPTAERAPVRHHPPISAHFGK